LVIVVLQSSGCAGQQGRQSFLSLDQRHSQQIFTIEEQQVEQEKDQRAFARVAGVLDQVKGGPTIRQHAAEFAVEVGVLRRQGSNGLGDGRVLLRPVIAPAREYI